MRREAELFGNVPLAMKELVADGLLGGRLMENSREMMRRLFDVAEDVFWPKGVGAKFGRVIGGLSLLSLVNHGFDSGLGACLQVLLRHYETLLRRMLEWAELFIRAALRLIPFEWEPTLHAHWRHVFVLMGIYFFRQVGVNFAERLFATGCFNFLVGFVGALVASAGAGLVPLGRTEIGPNVLVGLIPIVGAFFVVSLGFVWDATFGRQEHVHNRSIPTETWRSHLSWGWSRVLWRTGIGTLVLATGVAVLAACDVPNSGLIMLALLVLIFALYWLWDGVADAEGIMADDESWWSAYRRSRRTQLGVAMLGVYGWSGLFLISNVGLSLFGLCQGFTA